MEGKAIKCPGCGAYVDVLEGKEVQFCQHCGTKIMIPKEEAGTQIDNSVDMYGVGKAVNAAASVAKSYISAKEREKQREFEKEIEQERYLRDHPEEKAKQEKTENHIALGLVLTLVIIIGGVITLVALGILK